MTPFLAGPAERGHPPFAAMFPLLENALEFLGILMDARPFGRRDETTRVVRLGFSPPMAFIWPSSDAGKYSQPTPKLEESGP